ncbi:MAG: hypothetical protein HY763_09485 [Planctomycetes bacterium]|nr:hypothetical protein [Planctomycetota bacterium]
MRLAWKRFRVYVRGIAVVAAALAVAVVLFQNRANEVSFWFFGLTDETRKINVVWLILSTAAATRLMWWVFALGWGLWRDWREVKRLEAARALVQRAAELEARERQRASATTPVGEKPGADG